MKFSAHCPVSFQSTPTVTTSMLLYCRCVLQVFQYELCLFLCHCCLASGSAGLWVCVWNDCLYRFSRGPLPLWASVSHLDGAEVLLQGPDKSTREMSLSHESCGAACVTFSAWSFPSFLSDSFLGCTAVSLVGITRAWWRWQTPKHGDDPSRDISECWLMNGVEIRDECCACCAFNSPWEALVCAGAVTMMMPLRGC